MAFTGGTGGRGRNHEAADEDASEIEPMFSDFKSRGFGVENTQIQHADRLARLLLFMVLALYRAVSTGL